MLFWGVRRIHSRHKNDIPEEQESKEKNKQYFSFVHSNASIWILLLFIAMVLSAAGNSRFAYSAAFGIEDFNWIWDIFYNSDHLCLAAGLIGYKHFFSFKRVDELQH